MADAARPLPPNLTAAPLLSQWLQVAGDGTVTLTPGKVEIGQGLLTALAQIAAEELDVPLAMVRLSPASTATSPDEGVTSGSLSVGTSGMAIRQVAAEVRALFAAEAARRFGMPVDALTVEDGIWRGPGNHAVSYGALADAVPLDLPATGVARPKAATDRHVAGQTQPRIDIPGRVFGTRPFIHDMTLPGLCHGRVLRRPHGRTLASFDHTRFEARCPDVTLLRDGQFIGLVAPTEWAAEQALAVLNAATVWQPAAREPATEARAPLTSCVAERASNTPSPGGDRITRSYHKPYLAHASIGPSCAVARWTDGTLQVWSHTQGIFNLRADLALVFGLDVSDITVTHAEGAGCYGHNGADDAALDAALLARAVPGQPVRVLWSRADELNSSPFGAAMRMDLSATLSPDGRISDWTHDLWSSGHTARPGRAPTPALLASFDLARPFPPLAASDPPLASGGGAERNAVPAYDLPRYIITKHQLRDGPLRTSSMRSLGAIGNVFAIESFMDELAEQAGLDPLAFRLRHLTDVRAMAVLKRAVAMADGLAAPNGKGRGQSLGRGQTLGRGLAYARYKNTGGHCAIMAEVDVEHEPRATRLWIAADIGEVINPDGAINQIEGGAIQAVSWALKEEVRLTNGKPDCAAWESYPILRFSEVPEVRVELISHPEAPPLGAGEIAQGPTAAALANAIHAALGVRVRQMPLTRDRVLAAME